MGNRNKKKLLDPFEICTNLSKTFTMVATPLAFEFLISLKSFSRKFLPTRIQPFVNLSLEHIPKISRKNISSERKKDE